MRAACEATPASGAFELENLVPSDVESTPKGYTVWADLNIRSGFRAQQLRTPWKRNVLVSGGQTTDLADAFVLDPGVQLGDIRLVGPTVESGGACVQHLYVGDHVEL